MGVYGSARARGAVQLEQCRRLGKIGERRYRFKFYVYRFSIPSTLLLHFLLYLFDHLPFRLTDLWLLQSA